MKKRLLLILMAMMCLAPVSFAQTLRNSSNSMIGKIEGDGTVRNGTNSCIGYAKGVKKEYAAVYFFFNFFK